VSVKGGAVVRVADLGDVFPGAPDRTLARHRQRASGALVNVSQQVGANILDVRDGVETRCAS
jgi:multidrug efflux pump subunit AcrB